MKLLLSSYTLSSFPLWEAFLLAKEAGFDGIELVITPWVLLGGRERIKRLQARHGVRVLSVHQPRWHWPHTTKGMLRRLALFAKDIGARNVVVHLAVLRFHKKETIFKFIKSLEAKHRITISLENSKRRGLEQPPVWAWDTNQIAAVAEKHNLNLTFDVPKLRVNGQDAQEFFTKLESKIKVIHLHGWRKKDIHLPLAVNKTELTSFLKCIKDIGFDKLLTLEVFYLAKNHHHSWPKEMKETVKKDVAFIRDSC